MQGKPSLPCVPLAQGAFDFVEERDRHEMANRFEKSAKRAHRGNVPVVRVEVLDRPILSPQGQLALWVFSVDPLKAPDKPVPGEDLESNENERQENIEYLCSHPQQFIGYVIDQMIEALAGIGNAVEKQANLDWIFASDIVGHVTYTEEVRDERSGEVEVVQLRRPVFSRDVPMTFQWCCRALGLSAERFQTHVLEALEHAETDTRRREQAGELKPGRHMTYRNARQYAEKLQ